MGEGLPFDDADEPPFDDALDAMLQDDALLELFVDTLEDVHPRLAPVVDEQWDPDDAA